MTFKPTGKVLVMHLVGGIGNQLFCYYAGGVLANQINRSLSLDFADVNYGHNVEDIAKFNLSCQSEKSTLKVVLKHFSIYNFIEALNYKVRIPKRLKGSILFPIMEAEIGEIGKFRKRKRIHVAGYFQTHEYFDQHQKLFPNSNILLSESDYLSTRRGFNWNRTLGIHVRRGDYLGHRNTFGLLSKDWYRDALKIAFNSLRNEIDAVVFFTNDSDWVSANLEPIIDTAKYRVIVESDSETTSATEVFKEMTKCKGLIISNSTYSLMAAYHSPAMVFTPDIFFKSHVSRLLEDTRENWVKIRSSWEE